MKTKVFSIITVICLIFIKSIVCTTATTHVYVSNCTPLQFEVSVDYEGTDNTQQKISENKSLTIPAYDIQEEKKLVLSINRFLPQGEHVYTIKLVHGTEIIHLKLKFVSENINKENELGISLASTYLHDPWFMNLQAKERHEHLLTIDGHTIIIIYYAYDDNMSEDIEYTLCERASTQLKASDQIHLYNKTLAYSLTIPVSSRIAAENKLQKLITIHPQAISTLYRAILIKKIHTKQCQSQEELSSQLETTFSQIFEQCAPCSQKKDPITNQQNDAIAVEEGFCSTQQLLTPQHEILGYIAKQKHWYTGCSTIDTKKTYFCVPRNTSVASYKNNN